MIDSPHRSITTAAALAFICAGCASLETKLQTTSAATIAEQQPIYESSEVTSPPSVIRRTRVKVPKTLLASAGGAKVILAVVISADGTPFIENVLEKSEGPAAIAFIDSVKEWTFNPGKIADRKVATRMELTFVHNRSELNGLTHQDGDSNVFGVFTPDNTPDIDPFVGQYQKK